MTKLFLAFIIKHIVLLVMKELIVIDRFVLEVWFLMSHIVLKILLLNVEGMENVIMGYVYATLLTLENHVQIIIEQNVKEKYHLFIHYHIVLVGML